MSYCYTLGRFDRAQQWRREGENVLTGVVRGEILWELLC